ncbi:MAG: site-specific integrase [Anderseniella sp.]
MALAAILRFEQSTKFKSFKQFNLEQPAAFKEAMQDDKNKRTGKPLSKATIDATLRHVKTFFHWLAGENGYKSRISYSHAAYFNNNAKDARAAHARRETPFPTLEQCDHTFRLMPTETETQRRNKALFAFLMLTGARDGAIASFKLKHINLSDECVFQDARDTKTKSSKTFTTWFLPVDKMYHESFYSWVEYLRTEKLFGNDDALFPKPKMGLGVAGGFANLGLSRECYANATVIREAIKAAFVNAGLSAFGPHSFRKTLAVYGDTICRDRESYKAWSLNLGHDSIITTVGAYHPIPVSRQAEIIKGMRKQKK